MISPSLNARTAMLKTLFSQEFTTGDLIWAGVRVDGLLSYFDCRTQAKVLLKNFREQNRIVGVLGKKNHWKKAP